MEVIASCQTCLDSSNEGWLDIEDMLKTVAFIKGHKWSTMMIKRVYFGNWYD